MTVNKKRFARIAQLAVLILAGLFTITALAALASRQKSHQGITALLERYNPPEKPPEKDKPPTPDDKKKDDKKKKSPQQEQVDRIVKRSIFSVAKKDKGFSLKLAGILGETVYFQGENKGFTVGQTHKDAKIKQIGPDWVKIDFKGKEKTLYVFAEDKGSGPSKPSGPGAMPGRPAPAQRGRGPGKIPPGFELTPEMIERFKSMPDQMRQKALERMPAEFREKIEKEL